LVKDGDTTAVDKLNRFFGSLAEWKTARQDAVVEAMRVSRSDENALVNQVMRHMAVERIAPLLAAIVTQGVTEKAFTAPQPGQAGRILVALIGDLNSALLDLFLANENPEQTVAAYTDAVERVLGTRGITLVEPAVLRVWFHEKG